MAISWFWTHLLCLISFTATLHYASGYVSRDPNGRITIRWDILSRTPDGYLAVVNITNYQKYRTINAPDWKLRWTWPHKEVIWGILGARVIDQGDFPPTIIDLTANSTFDEKINGCCKGGVLVSRVQGFNQSTAAFQIADTTWWVPQTTLLW
ncbi:hypothetical protein UlMin_040046 [Ulmus minor]